MSLQPPTITDKDKHLSFEATYQYRRHNMEWGLGDRVNLPPQVLVDLIANKLRQWFDAIRAEAKKDC